MFIFSNNAFLVAYKSQLNNIYFYKLKRYYLYIYKDYLIDTCLSAQDDFRKILDFFEIEVS